MHDDGTQHEHVADEPTLGFGEGPIVEGTPTHDPADDDARELLTIQEMAESDDAAATLADDSRGVFDHHSEPPTGRDELADAALERLTQQGDAEPRLRGKITAPDELSDVYMVLWAWKPPRGERPRYEEVGYVAASSGDLAKSRALEHDGRSPKPIGERGDVAQFLIARAEERGILLRAVPARYWPGGVDVTGMFRPPPILTIR